MATPISVPTLGESVTQATLIRWHKKDGDNVAAGDPVCELETDKANVDLPAPVAGVLRRVTAEGDTIRVGDVIGRIDTVGAGASAAAPAPVAVAAASQGAAQPQSGGSSQSAKSLDDLPPGARRLAEQEKVDPAGLSGTGRGGRVTKEDVQSAVDSRAAQPASNSGNGSQSAPASAAPTPAAAAPTTVPTPSTVRHEPPASLTSSSKAPQTAIITFDEHGEHRAPMSRIRRRIAENLVKAQQTAAILTTFNEVDMHAVMEIRSKWKDDFQKIHNVGLGFMSFFAKAVVQGLKEFPHVNAFIDGENILYHQHVHLGIAVSTDRGLAVPVLRNAQNLSFARIENEIKRLATAVRDGKLGLEELSGGTFTITNGGVFGSLLSTPIVNPPQSGILGMHTIQKRAVVINDKIEIRPMMYLALSYDHRIVDGKDAIGFLVRIKQLLEDPARLMLEV